MKQFILIISMLFIFSICIVTDAKPNDTNTILVTNLNKIENLYFKYLNNSEKKEAILLMNEIRNIISSNPFPESNIITSEYNMLNDEGFQALYKQVISENSDSSKTTLITGALGKKGKILCKQLEQLIEAYSFDHYKEELLYAIADNILDPVNIVIVLKHINSKITQEELANFFKKR